jgi:hypothetical protein
MNVAGGILFGVAFVSAARGIEKGSPVKNYMMIAAYGLVLLFVSGTGTVNQASYPPYGLATVSFLGLSSYLVLVGLYSSAISVSEDVKLRQSIRKSLSDDPKLLESIGVAQLEHDMKRRVLKIAESYSNAMAEDTGVKPSITDAEIGEYVDTVLEELGRSNSSFFRTTKGQSRSKDSEAE